MLWQNLAFNKDIYILGSLLATFLLIGMMNTLENGLIKEENGLFWFIVEA